MLSLRGVHAGYGGGDVLRGLDLEVAEGSITCVVGPNGAGKSTVLRVISGLLPARGGSVVLDGSPIERLGSAAILARGIAQVPQSRALFGRMTVRENVLLGGYLLRRDRALVERRYREVAELVPLIADRSHQRAGNLSGGQRRMVEIARCLMLRPRLLMLDEPSLGLDPRSLAAVTGVIRSVIEAGATVLLVEQNVRLGLGMASHGVVMEGGRVRLQGSAAEVRDNPEVAELYLGGAPGGTGRPCAAGDDGG